jgi:hypothetical protein
MNSWQKIINTCLAIIITLFIFMIEKLEDRVRILESSVNEESFEEKISTLSIEDEFLDCNLDKVLNMDGDFKDNLFISVLKKDDQIKFDSIVASGDGMNDYLNGDQYIYSDDNPHIGYMISNSKKEFHIHKHSGGMVVYKCSFSEIL